MKEQIVCRIGNGQSEFNEPMEFEGHTDNELVLQALSTVNTFNSTLKPHEQARHILYITKDNVDTVIYDIRRNR